MRTTLSLMVTWMIQVLATASFLTLCWTTTTNAFLVLPSTPSSASLSSSCSQQLSSTTRLHQSTPSSPIREDQEQQRIDVVLFGIGDLRVDDHGGFQAALQQQQQSAASASESESASAESNSQILPLVILDPAHLAQLPMAQSHAMDTAAMIAAALADLQQSLLIHWGLTLHIISTTTSIDQTLHDLSTSLSTTPSLSTSSTAADVHIHVCDLDPVDNAMAYGPYSWLHQKKTTANVHAWTCHLRDEPWKDATNLLQITSDSSYLDYERTYQRAIAMLPPIDTPRQIVPEERRFDASSLSNAVTTTTTVPTAEQLLDSILQATSSNSNNSSEQRQRQRCRDEQGTGLFGTHWGGLSSSDTVGETRVWQTVQDYCIDCQEKDDAWMQHPSKPTIQRKSTSLEHASMLWMLTGHNDDKTAASNNWIAGESMTRYLAAPLWLGTISPRRLGQTSAQTAPSSPFYTSALQRMVEGREWHKLLAATACATSTATTTATTTAATATDKDKLEYGYWRWHGFLCRYAKKNLTNQKSKKDALLLVHGFGASSTQWQRSIHALGGQQQQQASSSFHQVLAPDLIGFGQCEKPALTYTQYLWSGFVNDFAKEVGIGKESWDSFVIGGNSIGGYTSMGVAADDSVQVGDKEVLSSMGAPGTNRCTGLALFNSAGNIQTKEEILAMRKESTQNGSSSNKSLVTVAQMTATNGLPPCQPPPRPVARVLGNALLTYLRPNIGPICKKVYPTNPDAADEGLAKNILRDSLDPGAVNVMISGSKLPTPRTANELLGSDFGSARDAAATTTTVDGAVSVVKEGIFTGPVLVAQGMLDPLNDAKGRATMLAALREGITVSPIDGGHCPHDEMPQESMRALLQWTEQRAAAASAVVLGDMVAAASSNSK